MREVEPSRDARWEGVKTSLLHAASAAAGTRHSDLVRRDCITTPYGGMVFLTARAGMRRLSGRRRGATHDVDTLSPIATSASAVVRMRSMRPHSNDVGVTGE